MVFFQGSGEHLFLGSWGTNRTFWDFKDQGVGISGKTFYGALGRDVIALLGGRFGNITPHSTTILQMNVVY